MPIQTQRTFAASYDRVWAAVVSSLAEDGAPLQAIEKQSGVVTTQFVTLGAGYGTEAALKSIAFKPGSWITTFTDARYTLSIFVAKVDSANTTVRVTPHIEAWEATFKSWYNATSNGGLERRLFDRVQSRL